MTVTVGATISGSTFAVRHSGIGPFISSAGNVYFFGVSSGNVVPVKASNPMSAFTSQTAPL